MSKEQKAKLRAEYIGLGGSEKTVRVTSAACPPRAALTSSQAMPSNLFLNIIIGMSIFALIGKGMGLY